MQLAVDKHTYYYLWLDCAPIYAVERLIVEHTCSENKQSCFRSFVNRTLMEDKRESVFYS